MIPILAQIVQRYLPGYKIEELAAGEEIKAREFSYSAQVYLLMLGQLAHVFSLNELVDLSTIFSGELRRIRGTVVKRAPRKDLPKGVISDETIRLTGTTTGSGYPRTLRRVKALVEVKGEMREMAFCTNNFEWSASTVAGLYKARWAVELLFKELKQTLQLQSFFGENQNAVEWQIWAAMLTHLVLRYIRWKNKVVSSYTRFAAIIKNTIWLKRSLEAVISFYCIAPSQSRPSPDETMPYLPGFERLAIA